MLFGFFSIIIIFIVACMLSTWYTRLGLLVDFSLSNNLIFGYRYKRKQRMYIANREIDLRARPLKFRDGHGAIASGKIKIDV